MGSIGTVTGIVAAPASMLGSYLWNTLGAQYPFYAASIIGLAGAILFSMGVMEPTRHIDEAVSPPP